MGNLLRSLVRPGNDAFLSEHFEHGEIVVSHILSYEKYARVARNQAVIMEYLKYDINQRTYDWATKVLTAKDNALRVPGRYWAQNREDRVIFVSTDNIEGIRFSVTVPMQLKRVYDSFAGKDKIIETPCDITVKGFYSVRVWKPEYFLKRDLLRANRLTRAGFARAMEYDILRFVRQGLVELSGNQEKSIFKMAGQGNYSELSRRCKKYLDGCFKASNFILDAFVITEIGIPEDIKAHMKKRAEEISDTVTERRKNEILARPGSADYVRNLRKEDILELKEKADLLGISVMDLIREETMRIYAEHGITSTMMSMNTAASF